jgi:hypothetical protein
LLSFVLERKFVVSIYKDLRKKEKILFSEPIEFYIGEDLPKIPGKRKKIDVGQHIFNHPTEDDIRKLFLTSPETSKVFRKLWEYFRDYEGKW